MTRLLALMGSPRKGKNTDTLCDAVIAGARKIGANIRKVSIVELKIHPCTACEGCHKTGHCILQDDYYRIYQEYDKADCIVVASPIYFHSVSAQLKAAIDRTQAFWASKYVIGKTAISKNKLRVGLFIATGGAPESENSFGPAMEVVRVFFRAINTTWWDCLLVPDTDTQPVWCNQRLIARAQEMGRLLVEEWLRKSS